MVLGPSLTLRDVRRAGSDDAAIHADRATLVPILPVLLAARMGCLRMTDDPWARSLRRQRDAARAEVARLQLQLAKGKKVKRPLWNRALRQATAAVCAYEAVAIELDREQTPTFSRLAGRHRWLAPALLAALAVHLWAWPEGEVPEWAMRCYRSIVGGGRS